MPLSGSKRRFLAAMISEWGRGWWALILTLILLVDRDLVRVGSVIKVLQALQNQGVTIKSVQQEPLRQSESQIGSVVVGTEPVFQK